MMDVVRSFKSLVKVEDIRTDNNVFRLHYKLTVLMLVVFSILLTSKQYFGDPIQCTANENKDVIEASCWLHGTYINTDTIHGENGHLPGMGTDRRTLRPGAKDYEGRIWHQYYQWVCIVFCIQALFFYIPRYMWKSWEGGRLRLLVTDLNTPFVTSAWNTNTKTQTIQYLLSGTYFHKLYAIRYVTCETLNLVNLIFAMDWMLNGQFYLYGLQFLSGENPMDRVFPKQAKCPFWDYGASGTIQNRDYFCVLSLNILNEKLFLALWFWFFFLALVTSLSLIYRFCVIVMPKTRVYLLMAQARYIGSKQAKFIINKISYGDFFILYHVGKNINPIIYRDLVQGIYETLKTKHPYGNNVDINI